MTRQETSLPLLPKAASWAVQRSRSRASHIEASRAVGSSQKEESKLDSIMVESQKIPGVDLRATSEPRVVRVLVKAPWQKEEFLVHQEMPVREFKEHVGRHFSSSPDRVVLVYAGRILKDHKTLGQHRLHLDDDATIHVVIRSHRPPPSRQPSAVLAHPTLDQKSPPSSSFTSDGLRELTASLGLNTANFSEFQTQLMSNPDLMLQLLENPFIQSKLSSPDLMKELVTNNPQVQKVIQKAPDISHVFSSPEGMKLVVELARNPAAVRAILKPPPQNLSFPSGDSNSSLLQGPFVEMLQKGLPRKLLPASTGGHHGEKMPAREWSLPPNIRPLRPAAQTFPNAGSYPSHGESSTAKEGAGQLVSTTVKNLLHQIIRHLLESIASGPNRNTAGQGLSHAPELVAKVIRKNAAVPRNVREQAAVHVPALLQQIQNTDVFWANWTPKEIQGLLEIQQRLQALAADEPAKKAERAEQPTRRAHSNTSLGDGPPPASRLGPPPGFSTQQILQALAGTEWGAAGAKRGSSAQPSSKQQRTYKL
ncbi:ubiquilin-1-like [Heteronotia binoei]|uniref:ubiquilin-1-like n=1 Tax=Heteronotia binoei TaxID=13085 RepID=UPI00292D20B3|nr:ubiquilin-1-like [Heteronotia binoei]